MRQAAKEGIFPIGWRMNQWLLMLRTIPNAKTGVVLALAAAHHAGFLFWFYRALHAELFVIFSHFHVQSSFLDLILTHSLGRTRQR